MEYIAKFSGKIKNMFFVERETICDSDSIVGTNWYGCTAGAYTHLYGPLKIMNLQFLTLAISMGTYK